MEPEYSVHYPLGRSTHEVKEPQARLGSLDNRTIAFVWSYGFRGEEMFDILEMRMREHFPGIRFVDYQRFGNIHGDREREVVEALPQRLRSANVDAAVVGVAA